MTRWRGGTGREERAHQGSSKRCAPGVHQPSVSQQQLPGHLLGHWVSLTCCVALGITREQPQAFSLEHVCHCCWKSSTTMLQEWFCVFREHLALTVCVHDNLLWDSEKGRDSIHHRIQYFIDFQSELVFYSVKSQHPRSLKLAHRNPGLKTGRVKVLFMARPLTVFRTRWSPLVPGCWYRSSSIC